MKVYPQKLGYYKHLGVTSHHINYKKTKIMRLTKKHKEIIAYFLSLNVEEMPEGETKKLTWEIISHYGSQGVYGHCEGTFEDTMVYDDEY